MGFTHWRVVGFELNQDVGLVFDLYVRGLFIVNT